MPSPDQQPNPEPIEAADQDPTLGAINEVTATLGGAAVGAAAAERSMPDTPEGRMLEGAINSPMSESLRSQVRSVRRKAFLMNQILMQGAEPMDDDAVAAIVNGLAFNEAARSSEMEQVLQEIRGFLFGAGEPDLFELQRHADKLVGTLTRDAGVIDMADLPLLLRETFALEDVLLRDANKAAVARNMDKVRQFDHAVMASAVHAVDVMELHGDAIAPVQDMFRRVFGSEAQGGEHTRLDHAQMVIRDRVVVSEMVVGASMYHELPLKGRPTRGTSPYARQLTPTEAADLNAAAADTLERLHLLRRYGVGSFEVDSQTIGLPWDVAVMPPLAWTADGTPEYAEGAVADYLFLMPDAHTDIQLKMTAEEPGVTVVKPGDARPVMRLRLHDDGSVSHGLSYHNVPGDLTQQTFEENGCGSAFQCLRAVMIGLAFDAVVPDDVLRGPQVQTSVAERLRQRPLTQSQSSGRITELLLRRRRALQDAGVSPRHPRPRGEEWQGPTRPVDGYRRRLPPGTRRRPEAEEQAHKFYASIGIKFEGLAEDENFVNGYNRPVKTEVQYRRARFRRDSETRKFMDQAGARGRTAQPPAGTREDDRARAKDMVQSLTPAERAELLRLVGRNLLSPNIPEDPRRRR